MNTESELPEDVLVAIKANRKIEAIKLLREHQNIDLKDAKDIVDAYISNNPYLNVHQNRQSDTGVGRLIFIVIVIGVLYTASKIWR